MADALQFFTLLEMTKQDLVEVITSIGGEAGPDIWSDVTLQAADAAIWLHIPEGDLEWIIEDHPELFQRLLGANPKSVVFTDITATDGSRLLARRFAVALFERWPSSMM